jgi:hypothetical protein
MLDQVPKTEPPPDRHRGGASVTLALCTLVGLVAGAIAAHPMIGALIGLAIGLIAAALIGGATRSAP